jgi:hypothetical protein
MEFTITQIANGGFTLVCLVGLAWFLKFLLYGDESGVNRFMDGWDKLGRSSEKIGDSVDTLNTFLRDTMSRQELMLGDNEANMRRQEEAGLAYCEFLRQRIEHEDLTDESKANLKSKVDQIEEKLKT